MDSQPINLQRLIIIRGQLVKKIKAIDSCISVKGGQRQEPRLIYCRPEPVKPLPPYEPPKPKKKYPTKPAGRIVTRVGETCDIWINRIRSQKHPNPLIGQDLQKTT